MCACVYTHRLKLYVSSKESATFYFPTSHPWPLFHIPGSWKPELWIFLFWTRSPFFNSETASPVHLHFSKNGNLKWYYKSFAKAQTGISSNTSLLKRKKSGGFREQDGTWVLTLNSWKHDCIPVNELLLSCSLQRINFPTKLDSSGSFHPSPFGRSDIIVCLRERSVPIDTYPPS